MKIVADINIPFLKGVLEPFAEVVYLPGKDIIAEVIKDADALIIRTRTNCNAELLEGSAVKFIATATIGFDHIDTDYCASRGIKWTNAPGCNSGSVMQYMATALAHLSEKYSFDYKDKTMGIVGVGNVGTKVARLATILGMNVLLNDPPRMRKEEKEDFVSLKEIQKKADIISFHVPLNKKGPDKTYHLFDEHFLEGIKAGTIIMNTSRGKVVKTEALKKGLKKEKIKAAVVDVWEKEPDIDTELLQLVDIGTPHIAGYSTDGKAMGTALSVQAISRFFGFGLDNWYLENIPSVSNKEIKMDCRGLSRQEIVNKAILATYDLLKDDTTLRNSPETFEKQREKYPVRREFKG
jgi:erythronate-4-phosphate dehydrogenase